MRLRLVPIVALCAMATLLAGCASTGGLHSHAHRTDASSLHSQRSLAGIKVDAAAWPQHDWWKVLDDAELDGLITEALAHNPDMTLARARVRAARAAAGAADADRKPTLNAGGSIAGARVPPLLPPIANGHFGVIRYAYLSFNWGLDLWGGKRAAWEAAVGQARAGEVDAEAARLKLSVAVAQAYFQLGAAYVMRDLARQELSRAQDFLKLTNQRVQSGIENHLPLEQAKSEVASDKGRLEVASNQVQTDGLVLAALLGRGPDRALSIKRPRLPDVPALTLPSTLPADLLGRRPDVVAARWRVEAASKNIKAAKTQFLPNVSIGALAGLIAPSQMSFFSLRNRFFDIAPAVSLPIFEGGKLRANLAGQEAKRDMAVARYNKTLVQAINQVATQVDNLRSLKQQVTHADTARASAQHGYKLAMKRFRAGVGNFLEPLTERRELIGAERRVATIKVERLNAWVRLNQSLGGGFEPRQSPSEPASAASVSPVSTPASRR